MIQPKPAWGVVLQLISSQIARFIEEHKPHRWQHFVLTCIDGRFIVRTILWLITHGHFVFDLRSEVGSVKAIVDQSDDWEALKRTIGVSMELHRICEFILVIHRDCGAYKSQIAHSEVNEKDFMIGQYQEAKKLLKQEFGGDISVVGVWVDWRGSEVIH